MTAAESYQNQPFPQDTDFYKFLFESSPLPMWIYDLDSLKFVEVNDAAVHRYGYTRSEFLSMTTNDLRPADTMETAGAQFIKEWRGWRHRLKNGEIIEVEITTQGLKYKGRRSAFAIISNIRDDRGTEKTQDDDGRFQKIFESVRSPMILLDPETGQVLEANETAAAFYGYAKDELVGMEFSDFVVAVDMEPASAFSDFVKAVSGNRTKSYHRFSNGDNREVMAEGTEIKSGDKTLLIVNVGDAPAASNEQPEVTGMPDGDKIPRDLLELLPVGYYRRSGDGALADVNPAFASMLGYTKEELLTDSNENLIFMESRDGRSTDGSSSEGTEVHRLRKKDGGEVEVEDHYRFVSRAGDDLLHREGFCLEIHQEIAPQEREEPRSTEPVIMKLSDAVLLIRKSDFRVVEANEAAEKVFKLSHDGLLGRTIFDLSAEGLVESLRQQLNDTDAEGAVFDHIYTRGDGAPFPVEIKSQLIDIDGEDIIVTIARDCGDRKRAESELRNNEEKYRSIFEKSPLGILRFDTKGIVTDCNDSLATIMSASRQSIIGLKLLELPNKELAGTIRKVLDGRLAGHQGEYRSFTASKSIHVRATFTPVSSPNGTQSGGIAIFEDISEREKAANELRESERRYRLLYESSPVPYHLLDAEWKIVDVNTSWMDLLGYSRNEAVGKEFACFVAPEDADSLKERLDSFKTTGQLGNAEIDIVHKQGQRFTVAVEGKMVREPDGRIRQAQFMLYDITERKLAENALKESEQKFKSLAETASSAIFMYQKNKVCYVNAACSELTGYSEEELLKMNFWDVVHPDFRDLVRELGMARQRGEQVPNHFELKVLTRSGETRWVDFTAATANYKGELAVLGTVYDATDRKASKSKLEESEEQRRLLVEKSPDAIFIFTGGKIVYSNPAAVRLLEADDAGLLIGRSLSDLSAAESLKSIDAAVAEMKDTLGVVEVENAGLVGLRGGICRVNISAGPITYEGQRSIQVVARPSSEPQVGRRSSYPESLALNSVPGSIIVTDSSNVVLWVNPAFETLSGYKASEAEGKNVFELVGMGEKNGNLASTILGTISGGNVWRDGITCRRKDGTSWNEAVMITPVRDESEKVTHYVWVQQDTMMRKSFEDLLVKAKKLEGIGQLVGSVVHDYNNILGVILGYGEVLKKSLTEHGLARTSVEAILAATRKGTDLTRQLLDFEQEGVMSSRSVDVNRAIEMMHDMFLKSIGEDIGLDFVPLKGLWKARVDPIHLYEMLINLATNARDAIADSRGTLEVKTSNVVVDNPFVAKHPGFTQGEYVMISFSDTGKGMDRTIQDRIFEPFFTTKEEHATGLGLAAVHGMVKRNGGGITVRSSPGDGTTFCIYLPRFNDEGDAAEESPVTGDRLKSDKTVLVVEDQTDLLGVVKQQLEEYGYKVLTAPGPEEALDLCGEYPDDIDILLTDAILPGINGKELGGRIASIRPEIKTLIMSGYSAGSLEPEGVLAEGIGFLQKPFTAQELAGKIYRVLHP